MDDLTGRLVANAGVDRTAAEKAVGIIAQFLTKEGPTEKARALIRSMSGVDASPAVNSRMSSSSPSMLGAIGGVMGIGVQIVAAGLSMGEIRAVTRETMSFARGTAGDDAVGEIVGAIPGLGQFA
jgi:hypothetical protein